MSMDSAFQQRVVQAAEAVFSRNGRVGPLELFQEMSLLQAVHFASWRRGHSHTNYDELLMEGAERADALALLQPGIDCVLTKWQQRE